MIFGDNRCVCRVGISNVDDLLLGLANSSCEVYYFEFLYPSTKVESISIRVDISVEFEIGLIAKFKARGMLIIWTWRCIEVISEV